MNVRWQCGVGGIFLLLATLATACAEVTPQVRATVTTRAMSTILPITTATPAPIRTATSAPVVLRTPTLASDSITLTFWTTEDLAPGASPAGRVFKEQVDAFLAANPNVQIDIVYKKPYGKGGILDFLLTTNAVIPARVPDVVALDLAEAPQAADMLQPFDEWMPVEWRDGLFPFAKQAAQFNGRWMIVPLAVDIQHLVYDKTLVARAPRTWDDVLRQKQTWLLPVAGDEAFLLQYSALALMDTTVNPVSFDPIVTAQVLDFFKRGHDVGVIPDAALGLKNVEETWLPFAQGQVAMAHVSASRYLTERAQMPNATFAPLPTRDGRGAALVVGWGLGMTSREPARQVVAARFIRWLIQSERLATWLRAARRLPAHRGTLALAVEPPDYAAFLREQLERAAFMPASSTYAKSADVWRAVIPAVWKGQITPEEAARSIAAVGK